MDHQILSTLILSGKAIPIYLYERLSNINGIQHSPSSLRQITRYYGRALLVFALIALCALFSTLHVDAQDQPTAQGNGTIPGAIRVIKKTVPATPDIRFYFTMRRNGPILHLFALRHLGRKTFDGLEAGHGYKLTETVPAGWAQSSATCSDGSSVTNIHVTEGETVSCTFVNVQLGKLIVQQLTIPDRDTDTSFAITTGGGLAPSSLRLGNGESHIFANVMPGTNYRLSETVPAGWTLSGATCSNGSTVDRIRIDPGQTVTCTFTATQLGRLLVHKATTPDPDLTATQFNFTAGGGLIPASFVLRSGDTQTFANLVPRAGYSIVEQSIADWRLASAICDNNSSLSNIRIDPGQTVNCTFNNEATLVDLSLSMTDHDLIAEPGDTIVYTLQYQNSGNQDATGAFLTIQVPQFTTFAGPETLWDCALGAATGTQCTYTIGSLSGGVAAGQVQFKVHVDNPVPPSTTQIDSSATLGYSASASAAQSSEQTPINVVTGVSLQKDDGGVSVAPGETVAYTLTYGNSGNQTATSVTITETVPANTTFVGPSEEWSCAANSPAGTSCFHSVGTLETGSSGSLPFLVRLVDTLPVGIDRIENSATIGSATEPNSDFGTEVTEVTAVPDLLIRLTANTATVSPGEVIKYRVTYVNQGSQGSSGVHITAQLPPNVQFDATRSATGWQCANSTCQLPIGILASGGSGVVDFTLVLNRPIPAGITALLLTAQIADDGLNGQEHETQNNSASVSTSVVAPTDFFATKQDQLVTDRNGDGLVSPGDTLEYTMVLRNNSGAGVRQIVVTDPIDDNLLLTGTVTTDRGTVVEGNSAGARRIVVQVGDLDGAGGTATIRFRATVRTPLAAGIETVQNQATISSLDFAERRTDDPDTPGRRDATVTDLNPHIDLQALLSDALLVDADQNGKVTVGDTIIYDLALQNSGDVDAGALSVLIPLDANVQLVTGSVTISSGEIVEGSDDEQLIEIAVPSLAATASAAATFQVKIVKPTTSVRHQAAIVLDGAGGQDAVSSDDPDTAALDDATVTVVESIDIVSYQLYLPAVHR